MCHAPSAIPVLLYVHIPLILKHAYTQWKTHVHTCKPPKAHACRQKYIHTLNIYRRTCTYWHIYTHAHTGTYTYIHMHIHSHAIHNLHTHKHNINTCIHKCTHIHNIYIGMQTRLLLSVVTL